MDRRASFAVSALFVVACSGSAPTDAGATADTPDVAATQPDAPDVAASQPDAPAPDALPEDRPVAPTDVPRVIAPCDASPSDAGLTVRGRAYNFGPATASLRGGIVRVVERPERCAVLDSRNDFALDGFAQGELASLMLEHPDFAPIQTGTHAVPSTGITGISFQAPTWGIYRLMATASRVIPLDDRCQIAATVTAVGLSIDSPTPSHGEAGATVTIDPVPRDPEVVGPIYFNYYGPGSILPDRALRETTRDGGVLFLNVPPGEYTLTAHKTGMRFTQARFRCRAGWLVNASPPMGLQALP